jgi:hypothetical protein
MAVDHLRACLISVWVVMAAVTAKIWHLSAFFIIAGAPLLVTFVINRTKASQGIEEDAITTNRPIEHNYLPPSTEKVPNVELLVKGSSRELERSPSRRGSVRFLTNSEKEEATRRYRKILGLKRTKYSLIEIDKVLDYVLRILLSENEGGEDHEMHTTGELLGSLRRLDERQTNARKSAIRKYFFALGSARSVRNRVAHAQDYEPNLDTINTGLQAYEDFLSAAIQLS